MAKILVLLLTGKENIHAEMVAFNFAINAVKNAHSALEFLFLGRGVQALNSKQKKLSPVPRTDSGTKKSRVHCEGMQGEPGIRGT